MPSLAVSKDSNPFKVPIKEGIHTCMLSDVKFCARFRCNFGVMLLTEIVADRPEVQWIINLPLMLHVSFLGDSIFFLVIFGRTSRWIILMDLALLHDKPVFNSTF